uniref:FYVE, RhoGEF and PH domain containing 2 n=1 Tax=Pseudonaja textilis TaxID=8673 RepID=A0A670ZYH8_PSETE
IVKMIFSNISSIYQFHSQFFLPELKKRMEDWDSNPRLGDIIQKLAPFLKMYSEYVKNFDKAMRLITVWSEKSLPFQELISNIQKWEVSANLTLQHHMLEPIQRIPRYELLLKDYIQKLPLESPDKEDAQSKSFALVPSFRMREKKNLWEVYHRLGLDDDIVDPSNELIKEGPIQKISFRFNNTSERYLFLVRYFYLFIYFLNLFGLLDSESLFLQQSQSQELGKWAPQWVRDKLVTMCMRCREPFNAITRRRHHCRACGYVVCARCSEYRAELQYDKNGLKRVCVECYVSLTGNLLPVEQHGKHKGILEKESAEISGQSLMCSFLQLMDKNGKGNMRGWFVIPRDDPLVLYIYGAPQVRSPLSLGLHKLKYYLITEAFCSNFILPCDFPLLEGNHPTPA